MPRRILIIRTGGLGDSLLLWPALAALRRRFARARLDLMGIRSRLELLAVPGGADRALDVEGSGLHLLYQLEADPPEDVRRRFGDYDAVVVFAARGDFALAENLSACGAGEVHAFLPQAPEDRPRHAADHLLLALRRAELADPEDAPLRPLPVGAAERAAGEESLAAAGLGPGRLALIAPGSGSPAKNWPAERFARLAADLAGQGLEPALIEGPADRDAVAAVLGSSKRSLPVLADAEPAALKGLLAQAALYLGNDSGPTHLAALIGTPTVALFGPSDPLRWRPLGPRVELLRAEPPELSGIEPEAVSAACRKLAQRS